MTTTKLHRRAFGFRLSAFGAALWFAVCGVFGGDADVATMELEEHGSGRLDFEPRGEKLNGSIALTPRVIYAPPRRPDPFPATPLGGHDESGVYGRLMNLFDTQAHRMPGSPEYDAALAALEREARAAGLEPRRQRFSTLVPDVIDCRLTVAGAEVPGVLPLGPNHTAFGVTGPDGVSGPLVFVGDGRPGDFANAPLDKPWIAVMNLGTDLLYRAFQRGAAAAVLVEDARANQWETPRLFTSMPLSLPRVYVDHATAAAAGLFDADGSREAALTVNVTWKDAEAVNLWVEHAGDGRLFSGRTQEEAFVLAARLSTFGIVPGRSPSRRHAANVALLADVMTRLAAEGAKGRHVVAVFLGSHYSAHEGARHFYYAYSQGQAIKPDVHPLRERERGHRDEIRDLSRLDEALATGSWLASEPVTRPDDAPRPSVNEELGIEPTDDLAYDEDRLDVVRDVESRVRKILDAWVNGANFTLRTIKLEENRLNERRALLALAVDEAAARVAETGAEPGAASPAASPAAGFETELAAIDARLAELAAEEAPIVANKAVWNDLKRQVKARFIERGWLNRAEVAEGERDSVDYFDRVVAQARGDIARRRAEIVRALAQNRTHIELAERLAGRLVMGHFSFNFASDRAQWLLSPAGEDDTLYQFDHSIGFFIRHLAAFKTVAERVGLTRGDGALSVDGISGAYEPWTLCTPSPVPSEALAAQILKISGYQMQTLGDALDADEMPRAEARDLSGLAPRLATLFSALADAPEMSALSGLQNGKTDRNYLYTRTGGRFAGTRFVNFARGSSELEGPAAGALAVLNNNFRRVSAGHTRWPFARINAEGYVFMPQVVDTGASDATKRWAIGFDEYGRAVRVTSNNNAMYARLFYAHGGIIAKPFNPQSYTKNDPLKWLAARTNADPKYIRAWVDNRWAGYYSEIEDEVKYLANGLVLVGGDAALKDIMSAPGYPVGPGLLGLDTVRRGMLDYLRINNQRSAVMRNANIIDDSIETLHADTEQLASAAAEDRAAGAIAEASAKEVFGLATGLRAYEPLRDSTNDMVRAVLILMLLSIPFGFSLERLICGFTSIYKQIAGFAAFFLGTFALLYMTHPAFQLASAPVIIFLAFVIILMSGVVIAIVMGRFKQEVRKLQGLVSKVHSNAKESSTALASVLIGISGMRNRPLKTFLTAATIVLLTFTIMVFSSFISQTGVTEKYMGQGLGPDRIELHLPTFLEIPVELRDAIQTLYAKDYLITPRVAVFNDPVAVNLGVSGEFAILNPKNGVSVRLSGMLGVTPDEIARHDGVGDFAKVAPGLVEVAAEPGAPPVYLSRIFADKLAVREGDELRVRGRPFRYAGQFLPEGLQAQNLDDSRVLPPDFTATSQDNDLDKMGDKEQALANLDVTSFVWCEPDSMAITTVGGAKAVPGDVNYLTLYPRPGRDVNVETAAREIAQVVQAPVYSLVAGNTRRFFFTRELTGSGYGDIIVPLILGGLIIFSSLLGSIVDREKEIFTYSALGLAPPDVAALFFAESSVYAVVGGMGGYLISQAVAKIMAVLAGFGWVSPPEMNFSSLSSIYTILVVMATVLLSTIYPAMKAGKSANPGVARKWRMPAPEGDHLAFTFPFTVSATDLTGVLSFIREHFNNHSDACLGHFASRDVKLFRKADSAASADNASGLGIAATLTLAPFDLGVCQDFKLYSQNSDIAGIEEVRIELDRVSGAPKVWLRSNREFLDDLRNQFLLWRSLPIETMEHYRHETESTLGLMHATPRA